MTDHPTRPLSPPGREAIVAAMCNHFTSIIEASAGKPFAETDVHLPTKSFEGYAGAILSLTKGAGEAGDWRLIDTAPKDGTPMLFCNWTDPEQDVLPIVSGFWSRLSEGWFAELSGHMIKPTHWRPLLAPPALNPQTEARLPAGKGEL